MKLRFRPAKVLVFLLCLVPLAWLIWRGFTGDLTADPVNEITHKTGDWTLRFLLITLAVTPLRRLTKLYSLVQYRRMLGLFAFFYGCLHFLVWVVLFQYLGLQALAEAGQAKLTVGTLLQSMASDIAKRRYITIGMLGLTLMLPLAITSTRGWIRRLGRRWTKLHRLVYFAAAAGVVHYWWLVKKDTSEPRLYALILTGLLVIRVVFWTAGRKRTPAAVPAQAK